MSLTKRYTVIVMEEVICDPTNFPKTEDYQECNKKESLFSFCCPASKSEGPSDVYLGAMISEVVRFIDDRGHDALIALCDAIESLGESHHDDGSCLVDMGPLWDVACDYSRSQKAKQTLD